MIILITGMFDMYENNIPTGKKEFLVSHGVDEETMENICLPCVPPNQLEGSYFDDEIGEWCLYD